MLNVWNLNEDLNLLGARHQNPSFANPQAFRCRFNHLPLSSVEATKNVENKPMLLAILL